MIGEALEIPAANIDELEEVYQQQAEFSGRYLWEVVEI